jgi:thiamine biosynthesis lipoprotein
MHHLVDPATGRSVNTYWRTVSVAASSCVQANIATTAAIIRGDRAEDWLASLGVPARLVRLDGTVVCLGHWPVEVST